MICVVLWNDYDVYVSGFLHWLCTNSQKDIGYASLTERTLTILQMVNTRRGAESSQQGAENNPPPPPQTLAEVVAQQTQILQMLDHFSEGLWRWRGIIFRTLLGTLSTPSCVN